MSRFDYSVPGIFGYSPILADYTGKVNEAVSFFNLFSLKIIASCRLLLTRITSVLFMFICKSTFSASSATCYSLVCASSCLCARRLMSSAKSRSSNYFVRVHCMPILLSFVAFLITQPMTMSKIVGDSMHP